MNLENQNRLIYQRQLSKSVGDNLQQCKPKFNTLDNKNRLLRPCLSAGDLLGKTHEELILLLIQLKRNQSQLSNTIEKLRSEMESEDKLSIIEPHKIAEHKLKYEQVKEQLIETQNQYDSQTPLIDLIDNMVRFNSNSKTNLNTNLNSFSTNNVYLSSTNDKIDTNKATSISYLNNLEDLQVNGKQKMRLNDESDYYAGGESDTNNIESTYTNRSSCATGLNQLNDFNQSDRNQEQSSSKKLEIPSTSQKRHTTTNNNSQNSKLSDQQTSSQTTNTISSVIASNKHLQTNSNNLNNNNLQLKSKSLIEEEEMEKMKKQQKELEKELERVRNLLLNSQLNVSQEERNLNDEISTTENHFQLELENIDKEINNLNAKKEKLILSLKSKKDDKKVLNKDNRLKDEQNLFNNLRFNNAIGDAFEDGTEITDDAFFSTVNSIDFERVLDDENVLSICTDVDELTAHENEYVQSLKNEYEQNLKQQEEERKQELNKLKEERKQLGQIKTSVKNDDETTTETTIYKTLRLVKRKYDNSKLNKQLNLEGNNSKMTSNSQVLHGNDKLLHTDAQSNSGKLKTKNDEKTKDENELSNVVKNNKNTKSNSDLLGHQSSLDDDHLLPSEISQLLLDSALIIYEQLKPKRSTGSSVSSERSITDLNDEQSDDDDVGDAVAQSTLPQPSSANSIIKQQPRVTTLSTSIPTLLDLNKELNRDLNRTIEREINNIHHPTKLNNHHFRSPSNLIDNKCLMRELLFDSEYGFANNKVLDISKPKMMTANSRTKVNNKKKTMDKNGYTSNIEEERARIF